MGFNHRKQVDMHGYNLTISNIRMGVIKQVVQLALPCVH